MFFGQSDLTALSLLFLLEIEYLLLKIVSLSLADGPPGNVSQFIEQQNCVGDESLPSVCKELT